MKKIYANCASWGPKGGLLCWIYKGYNETMKKQKANCINKSEK